MGHSYFSSGTLQKERANQFLLPSYVDVEEKTTADFLLFVQNYAELIRYWNQQNNPQDNWQGFFEEDLSMLLANIHQIDVTTYPRRYDLIATDFHNTSLEFNEEQALIKLFLLVLELGDLIKNWCHQIVEDARKSNLNQAIEQQVLELVKANLWEGSLKLKSCYFYMRYSFQQSPDKIAHKDLGKKVFPLMDFYQSIVSEQPLIASEDKPVAEAPYDFSSFNSFFDYLEKLYHSLYGTIVLLQQSIPDFLHESLNENNHKPHVSLLLAFWEMMQETKQLMNQFTANHLDFYYHRVLQQQYAPFTPDKVLLYFSLSKTQKTAFLAKGTAFLAGNSPTGKPLAYQLDHDLVINETQPIAYKTIYNRAIKNEYSTPIPHLMYTNPIANSSNGLGGKFIRHPASWPTFGKDLTEVNSPNQTQLGFSVAHPILFLSEGNRQITFILKLTTDAVNKLKQGVIKVGINELDYWEGLEMIVNQSFSLTYTGATGWVAPTKVTTWLIPMNAVNETETDELGIAFFINIDNTLPAVSAYNVKHHGLGYTTEFPLLRCLVTQQIELKKSDLTHKINPKIAGTKTTIQLNPYSLFSQITIKEIPVYVEVEGVEQFNIQNDFSVLNPKKPYAPFGVKPVISNHFYIGNNEMFSKPLTFLGLKIQWFDLPKLPKGFSDYYYNYNLFRPDKAFSNAAFRWDIDLLANEGKQEKNKWLPLSFSQTLHPLAETQLPPDNPSKPKFNQRYLDHLKEKVTKTPNKPVNDTSKDKNALTKSVAHKILQSQGKFLGPNWKKNNTVPKKGDVKKDFTQDHAKKILGKLGQKYGENWHKNNQLPKKGKEDKKTLLKHHAKKILSQLGKKYGANWQPNNPLPASKSGGSVMQKDHARKLLSKLGQQYGDNWSKSTSAPKSQVPKETEQPPTPKLDKGYKFLTPKIAEEILKNKGEYTIAKTPPEKTTINKNKEALTANKAKGLLDTLSKSLGPNWLKNNQAPTNDSAEKEITAKVVAHRLAQTIMHPPAKKTKKDAAKPNSEESKSDASKKSGSTTSSKPLKTAAIKSATLPVGEPKKDTSSKTARAKPVDEQKGTSEEKIPKNYMFEWEDSLDSSEKEGETTNQDKNGTRATVGKSDLDEQHHSMLKELFQNVETHLVDGKKQYNFLNEFVNLTQERNQGTNPDLGFAKKLTGKLSSMFTKGKGLPNVEQPVEGKVLNKDSSNNSLTKEDTSRSATAENAPKSKDGKLKPATYLFLDDFKQVTWNKLTTPSAYSKKITYNNLSKDGYLRFTLTGPENAFGEAEYPRIVAATANFNMELMAKKAEKTKKSSTGSTSKKTPKTSEAKPPTSKLGIAMASIHAFLKDPYLKVVDKIPGYHIKELYQKALTAEVKINAIISTNSAGKQMNTLEKEFQDILAFLHAVGTILTKLGPVLPKEHKIKLAGLFKTVFATLPKIGGFAKVLAFSNPLVGTAVGLISKKIAKKTPSPSSPSFMELYNNALGAANKIKSLIDGIEAGTASGLLGNAPKTPLLPPRPAFVPKISKLIANYSAKDTIQFGTATNGVTNFFQIHPFGVTQAAPSQKQVALLPKYDQEGYLYIALEKVNAPEIATLLFEVNEESGNRDLPLPVIQWSYLQDGQLVPFLPSAVKDGTNGFSQSGVISFYLPYIENSAGDLIIDPHLPDDCYWLCATVSNNAAAVCEIIKVYAQAGIATFSSGDLDPSHFDTVLPTNKIKKFQKKHAHVAKINQPLTSFGGRPSENKSSFYQRVSERLRHKGRAVNAWDFEYLILQQFPNISYVKCLNHSSLTQAICPGHVSILILPTPVGDTIALSPKTDQGLISQVKEYVAELIDPNIVLHVRNPIYQYLQINLEVVLSAGLDPGHYFKILNEALIEQIAPWNKGIQSLNPFATNISYYSLTTFINQQPYIEEIVTFELTLLRSKSDKKGKTMEKNFKRIELDAPWMIISSIEQHQLKAITATEFLHRKSDTPISKKNKEKIKSKDSKQETFTKPASKLSKKEGEAAVVPTTKQSKQTDPENALLIGNELYPSRW